MKNRFSTIDIVAMVAELQKYIGMRLNQVYDIDSKSYLLKLNRQEEKVTLLIESGIRIHTTEFQWPKNPAPSGFSMKFRKHLKNKRLEKLTQLGIDRIIDLQFGSSEAAYHVILELYDRGNIVLTDYDYMILNILRPRTVESEDVKFMVRERYPVENARQPTETINRDEIYNALKDAQVGTNVKKILIPILPFGPALLEHVLSQSKFPKNCSVGKNFNVASDINHLFVCLVEAEKFMKDALSGSCKGYVIQKSESKPDVLGGTVITNIEFHPFLFAQHTSSLFIEYPSFDKAVDNFFSSVEGQRIDLKAFQKEKEAMKKLENVRKDHEHRLEKLQVDQQHDEKKAQLIEMNLEIVDRALLIIRSLIASQMSWSDIKELLKEAQRSRDPVACSIQHLKFEINHITVLLNDPYGDTAVSNSDSPSDVIVPIPVDVDLDLSAYANARKYYNLKRHLAKKEQKTIESSEQAFKSAERKTKLALKEVAITTSITKARKTFWFEKFLWFISSENYVVIAGRDIQQNELIVKRYLKPGDVYVHADIHGASSVIIKNFQGGEIPPKTLNEAGTMAICYSTAWDAKIVTSAWWVYHHQVSKKAPSGEYLTTGSFMIRGKKNYLPPSHLVLGFGFLFKLDDESMERRKEERNCKSEVALSSNVSESNEILDETDDLVLDDGSGSEKSEEPLLEDLDDKVENGGTEHDDGNTTNVEYPDTEVKFQALEIESKEEEEMAEDTTLIVQVPRRVKKNPKFKAHSTNEIKVEPLKEETKLGGPKRGRHGKLKKMKEKYKDQDEEERELRMKILASAGEHKEKKKKNKNSKGGFKSEIKKKVVQFDTNVGQEPSVTSVASEMDARIEETNDVNVKTAEEVTAPTVPEAEASDDEVEDVDNETQKSDELSIVNSLTGTPVAEDTLLFTIPMCGPYIAMLGYKYKLKVMPGNGRRGKAAKTALQVFLHEKSGTPREKDLLRSLKDQDISRNFPGKIKLSIPNQKKVK